MQKSLSTLRPLNKEIITPKVRHKIKTDSHSLEFSDWTENPLFVSENVAVMLNRMLRVTKNLLSKIQSARKILLRGSQPLDVERRRPPKTHLSVFG